MCLCVCVFVSQGRMVTEVLTERLDSVADSSDSYELEGEHTVIREYLWEEMRKRGWEGGGGETTGDKSSRAVSRSRSGEDVGVSSRQLQRRHKVADRTGRDVLLSSSDEDDSSSPPSTIPRAALHPRERASSSSVYRESPGTSSRGSASLPLGHGNRDTAGSSRQMKRPLVQDDQPALISEGRSGSLITGAHPIIDHWLEDDVDRPLPKKRRARDPFTTLSQGSRGRSLSLGSQQSARQGRLIYSSVTRSRRSTPSMATVSRSVDGARDVDLSEVVHVGSSPETGSPRELDPVTSRTVSQRLGPPTSAHSSSSQPPSNAATTPAAPLPLRIRVRIDGKSYLVPCPSTLSDGSHSTVSWLARQASERYYSQLGVRPRLSLTTADGALLSADDVLAHVLQSGEEVVGVVEAWHLPPLPERYLTACSSCAVGKLINTLQTQIPYIYVSSLCR